MSSEDWNGADQDDYEERVSGAWDELLDNVEEETPKKETPAVPKGDTEES